MRVLVAGASGHVASAVVPELLSAGQAVAGFHGRLTERDALPADPRIDADDAVSIVAALEHGGAFTVERGASLPSIHREFRHDPDLAPHPHPDSPGGRGPDPAR